MEKEKPKATSCHELTPGQRLLETSGDIAHPGDDDGIVVIAHPLHHPDAGDESDDDESSRDAEQCYDHSKDSWPTILHGQCSWVEQDCRGHSCSA